MYTVGAYLVLVLVSGTPLPINKILLSRIFWVERVNPISPVAWKL